METKSCNQREEIAPQSIGRRDVHLDLLRATAIALVVTYHLIQMSPVPLPRLMKIAVFGQYGVDLFFVLSGWLIGTLYWRGKARFANVHLTRFWLRRWLRTIPPYLVALALPWHAVLVERREPFDWGYLVFIQNYYETIPFSSVGRFVLCFFTWRGEPSASYQPVSGPSTFRSQFF